MKSIMLAAAVLLLQGTAQAEQIRSVKPEFHPLSADPAAPKRRLSGAHKQAGTEAPIRFETRVELDEQGQPHLHCDQVHHAEQAHAEHRHD